MALMKQFGIKLKGMKYFLLFDTAQELRDFIVKMNKLDKEERENGTKNN